jgi:CBS domain-containing protein
MRVGDLATREVVEIGPGRSLFEAAQVMAERRVGAAIVMDDREMVGIVTERDVLGAVARRADLDGTRVEDSMTTDVVSVGPDWAIYEATAEMAAHHIRHVVVREGSQILGVLSVRDVLLAGQRVELTRGSWVVLRDPLTFTVRERRRLQRYLLMLRGREPAEFELGGLIGLLVGSWSFEAPLPEDPGGLRSIPAADYELLRAAVLAELPDLQRAVHPSPGWRRR